MLLFTAILICIATLIILVMVRMWLNNLEEKSKPSAELIAWLQELSLRVEQSTQSVDRKLEANMSIFNNRLDSASTIIAQVHKSIGEFSEIGRSMQDLQQFLQSPKLRGNIGEHILKELLAQHFPAQSYELQYAFKNGEKVDALIKTSNGCIPIDSKFPMENFRKLHNSSLKEEKDKYKREFEKDVKKHIQDIARKYILTSEGTCDYALMYIPSEAIYYEIINNASLFDYAGEMKVLPVSPISFYAYMKAILMSLEGQRIESQAKEILRLLQSIKKDYEKMDTAFMTLNSHITHAYNQTAQVSKLFSSLGQKLSATNLISEKKEKSEEKLIE